MRVIRIINSLCLLVFVSVCARAVPLIWVQPAPDIMFSFITAEYNSTLDVFTANGAAETMRVWDSTKHAIVNVPIPYGVFTLVAPIDDHGKITPKAAALTITRPIDENNVETLLVADLKSFAFDAQPDGDFVFEFSVAAGTLVPTLNNGSAWLLMHELGNPAWMWPETGLGFPGDFSQSFVNVNPIDTNADFGLRGVPEPATAWLLAIGVGLLCWGRSGRRRRR